MNTAQLNLMFKLLCCKSFYENLQLFIYEWVHKQVEEYGAQEITKNKGEELSNPASHASSSDNSDQFVRSRIYCRALRF